MSTMQLRASIRGILLTFALLQLAGGTDFEFDFGMNLMQLPNEESVDVNCILALLRKYFNSGISYYGALMCVSLTGQRPNVEQQLLEAINLHEDFPWSVLTTRLKIRESAYQATYVMPEKPQCYFLIVESLDNEDMDEIFKYWRRMDNWNPLAQFVVYLTSVEQTDEEMTDLMVELLLIFMNNKFYNVNVIGTSHENNFYYGKTVFPYNPDNNCGNRVIAVDLLDACSYEEEADNESEEMVTYKNSSKLLLQEFTRAKFEDKFPRDLSGCPINAAYRGPWEPYIFISAQTEAEYEEHAASVNDTSGSYYENYLDEEPTEEEYNTDNRRSVQTSEYVGQEKLAGIEYELLETISKQLHVTINFLDKNANMFQIFQQLIEGHIELMVGGIDEDPSISAAVSSSTSYQQDELTWCVAKAKRKHNFFNFLASFNTYTWLLFLVFIITSSLAVLAAQHISKHYLGSLSNYLAICIRMLGILLTQAINVNTQELPTVLRLLFFLSFLMAFFFSNTYQSFLISTLTTPTAQAQISHVSEIYSNRMITMVSPDYVRHLGKEGRVFKYIRENLDVCYNIVDCLNEAADNEHIAVVASRQHAFYNARVQRDNLFCFDRKESLYVYPVTMLLPKKYQLLHLINAIIRSVIESGHMQKWSRDLDMVRFIRDKIARVQEDTLKPLTLAEFQGSFAFASVLLLLASLVFGLECLVHWLVVKRRTRLRIFRYLHRRFVRRRRAF